MITVSLQIGNSDDKLSQKEWASFVRDIKKVLMINEAFIHFFGAPSNHEEWQNACWVFNISDTSDLKSDILKIRTKYNQDSVAWLEGEAEAEFV